MFERVEWDRLLLAARGGDPRALGHLLEVANDDLRGATAAVLRHANPRRISAEDVFAHAMLAVLREIRSLRATSYTGFRYWFASIARNHVRGLLRTERARPDRGAQADASAPESEPVARAPESEAFLRHALLRLPRSQQIAFVLREGLALSWHTIAFVLERREAPAARLIHYRALLRIQALAGGRRSVGVELPALRA